MKNYYEIREYVKKETNLDFKNTPTYSALEEIYGIIQNQKRISAELTAIKQVADFLIEKDSHYSFIPKLEIVLDEENRRLLQAFEWDIFKMKMIDALSPDEVKEKRRSIQNISNAIRQILEDSTTITLYHSSKPLLDCLAVLSKGSVNRFSIEHLKQVNHNIEALGDSINTIDNIRIELWAEDHLIIINKLLKNVADFVDTYIRKDDVPNTTIEMR